MVTPAAGIVTTILQLLRIGRLFVMVKCLALCSASLHSNAYAFPMLRINANDRARVDTSRIGATHPESLPLAPQRRWNSFSGYGVSTLRAA